MGALCKVMHWNFESSHSCVSMQFFTSLEPYGLWLGYNSSQATIRPKFQKATIRPKRQFVPNSKKRQFVPSVNSSQFEKATIRPICKKRQFVPNCLIDQLITNRLKVETKKIIKPTTNEFMQPRDNNLNMLHFNVLVVEC